MTDLREPRIAAIAGAVARQALADRGASRIALLDDGGPEAELAARMLVSTLGADAVLRITVADGEMESVLHLAPEVSREQWAEEMRRMRARLAVDAIAAHPANKTALLLGGELPPEPLLPLGDLWASEVAALAGRWSAPEPVRRIAEAAGGIEALDAALRGSIDTRDPAALDALSSDAASAVRRALAAGRPSRLHPRIVPKIGARTLGVDLFD
ncbi:hypothetical protein [Longimicrobium sp.]|uniref:hypothetical protein n=1 Tax=Longimicrobium sp. TaxID=2029185 RepID=UPI002C878DDA|nr:hypothetical protein [Longimicrobium sp.]HSU13426.1 hypothetical protein [Longimicrobium sp.]